jgi:hypothetical protein|eukprot:COSAG03_NODE_2013_length_3219_cov_65.995192_2_plen_93_part_00
MEAQLSQEFAPGGLCTHFISRTREKGCWPHATRYINLLPGLTVLGVADLLPEATGAVGREISKQWMEDIELNVWLRQRRRGGGTRWVADSAR